MSVVSTFSTPVAIWHRAMSTAGHLIDIHHSSALIPYPQFAVGTSLVRHLAPSNTQNLVFWDRRRLANEAVVNDQQLGRGNGYIHTNRELPRDHPVTTLITGPR